MTDTHTLHATEMARLDFLQERIDRASREDSAYEARVLYREQQGVGDVNGVARPVVDGNARERLRQAAVESLDAAIEKAVIAGDRVRANSLYIRQQEVYRELPESDHDYINSNGDDNHILAPRCRRVGAVHT